MMMTATTTTTTTRSFWKWSLLVMAAFAMVTYRLDWKLVERLGAAAGKDLPVPIILSRGYNTTAISDLPHVQYSGTDPATLLPGELPGYTGWARPEKTLAGYFTAVEPQVPSAELFRPFRITLRCQGHDDCSSDRHSSARFFLRAYGPSVIPGTVVRRQEENHHDNDESNDDKGSYYTTYTIQFVFPDPGHYTVEAVLTFSTSPPLKAFPLSEEMQQPTYEGYLLPRFPLQVTVDDEPNDAADDDADTPVVSINNRDKNDELCLWEDLTVASSTDAIDMARWKVVSKSNTAEYSSMTMENNPVSKRGYVQNYNSIGINMEYRFRSGCSLLPISAFDPKLQGHRVFGSATCPAITDDNKEKLQIIYIGDSVLRVQKDKLRELVSRTPNVELHFLSLHLGYRRNQKLGPSNVQAFLEEIQKQHPNDTHVILFNTGLHDIHQLCGAENAADRRTYLNTTLLDSGTFSCTTEYRAVMQDFVKTIQAFPAELRVFQTSTAAWPKYGNWGVGWEHNPQRMPLVSDFSETFNEIAFEVLQEHNTNSSNDQKKILIMDGYWITYARPDNREYGDIGKKLSHPGDEVLSAMSRIWAKIIVDKVC